MKIMIVTMSIAFVLNAMFALIDVFALIDLFAHIDVGDAREENASNTKTRCMGQFSLFRLPCMLIAAT